MFTATVHRPGYGTRKATALTKEEAVELAYMQLVLETTHRDNIDTFVPDHKFFHGTIEGQAVWLNDAELIGVVEPYDSNLKTSHQLAAELLAGPNLPVQLVIKGNTNCGLVGQANVQEDNISKIIVLSN